MKPKSILLLIASLCVSLSSWIAVLPSWGAALEPMNLGAGLLIIGSVTATWLGQSPLKPKH